MRAIYCRLADDGAHARVVIAAALDRAAEGDRSRINRNWPGDNDLRAARYRDHMARNDRAICFADGRISDPLAEVA